MLEYLFVVCQYVTNDNRAVMKKVEVIKEVTVCTRLPNIACGSGLQVVFAGEKAAVNVRETGCLYVTKENQKEIKYEE